MKNLIDKVFLLNRTTGEFETAELFHGIDETNLSHIEGRWRPMFELRREQARASGQTMADINAEDGHWELGPKGTRSDFGPLPVRYLRLGNAAGTRRHCC